MSAFNRQSSKKKVPSERARQFRSIIRRYYKTQGRHDLPWRLTTNPYHILVSEIMLQQTQVERVIDKYHHFLHLFPDFSSLAEASVHSILNAWKGLGYNRRAIAMQRTAQTVMKKYGGALPSSEELLQQLPGIGHATASSICAFAFNMPTSFIETNIRRVFIHFFFPGRDNVKDSEILPLVQATLVRSNPRDWYAALMDYGTMLKKGVPNPNTRSSRYRKQSPFEGSRRQLRGRVLRIVMEDPGITEAALRRKSEADADRLKEVLRLLEKEGFLQKEGMRYRIV